MPDTKNHVRIPDDSYRKRSEFLLDVGRRTDASEDKTTVVEASLAILCGSQRGKRSQDGYGEGFKLNHGGREIGFV